MYLWKNKIFCNTVTKFDCIQADKREVSPLWSWMWLVKCKAVSWLPFICFIKASFNIVVKLIHYSLWTMDLMSPLAFESCRGRSCMGQVPPRAGGPLFNMEQLSLLFVSPVSICRVICELANYCWAELVTSFSLWICDGCWKCKNRQGEEEREESRAGLMKHTCCDITEEVTAPSGLNQLSVLILPNCILFTSHNMQPLHIPLGHDGALRCRAVIQSLSPRTDFTHSESVNCFKWLPCMNCVQLLCYFRWKVKQQMPSTIIRPKSYFFHAKNPICVSSSIEFM